MKRLYMCNGCLSIYERKYRAKECHYGDIVIYDIKITNRRREYDQKKNQEKSRGNIPTRMERFCKSTRKKSC